MGQTCIKYIILQNLRLRLSDLFKSDSQEIPQHLVQFFLFQLQSSFSSWFPPAWDNCVLRKRSQKYDLGDLDFRNNSAPCTQTHSFIHSLNSILLIAYYVKCTRQILLNFETAFQSVKWKIISYLHTSQGGFEDKNKK